MSMYNMVFRTNPLAGHILASLELLPDDFGRFRDAWLSDRDGDLVMVVHTRCGGGNRNEYGDVFDKMKQHPCYRDDYDCDFDSTYADIVFNIPDAARAEVNEFVESAEKNGLRDRAVDNRTQAEKWNAVLAALGQST